MNLPGRVPVPVTTILPGNQASLPVSYLHTPGRDETLLYFHGLGSSKEDFLDAWERPEWRSHTLVAFDAPGCGSDGERRPGEALCVDDVVAVAEALAEELGLDGLTLVGHSMGGLAALLFAERNPGLVRRFVNVEGNLGPEDCGVFSRRVFRERFLGREQRFLDSLERDFAASPDRGCRSFAASFRARIRPAAFFDYCRSIVEYSDETLLLERFLELDVPRLYVFGDANGHLGHLSALTGAGIPIHRVPGSDHFPAYSNPEDYYEALVAFVRRTAGHDHREDPPP